MYVKKFTSFCQILKRMHTKENWFLFYTSRCSCYSAARTQRPQADRPATGVRHRELLSSFGTNNTVYNFRQCSRIRILRFFRISKNVTFYVFLNDVSKSRKKSLAKV